MSSWYEQAEAKLKAEYSQVKGQKEQAMRSAVRDVLLEFCLQDEEFAQAVAQGGSFPDCMKAVAQGVGGSISDLEAYRRAAAFYFDGAEVQSVVTIRLTPAGSGWPIWKPGWGCPPETCTRSSGGCMTPGWTPCS